MTATTTISTILVVDDNRLNRMTLSRYLEQEGHRPVAAENGRQALDLLRAEHFDLVLLDIIMPELDGYTLLGIIKRDVALRDIPVIVISALDEMDTVVRCIELGAEDYLTKPFNSVLLRARLRTSLEKKQLRDLEVAYLQQEMMLRQSEKLSTLGRMSAGMAHELNNPAAAALRGTRQVAALFARIQADWLRLAAAGLDADRVAALAALAASTAERARHPMELDPLERSDREYAVESWLEARGIDGAWEIASDLVSAGYDAGELETLAAQFAPEHTADVVRWLCHAYQIDQVLAQVGSSTERISGIVNALKAYTYLDQAPVQAVNINEALESTLSVLGSKLTPDIIVHRRFAPDLPPVEAFGSELNQVWTNIIDNALDAVGSRGQITLRTALADGCVVVEIVDDGPGIPPDIQAKIFDPFFTTKPPGRGAGLGLNVAYTVIQKHNGGITVTSKPGETRFEVRLPLDAARARP